MEEKSRLWILVIVFAMIMVGMFSVFLARVPVRTLTPQIARLRYYACQNGVTGGPLSSSLREFDWRKAFAWRASDTEYRQRQFSQFFEVLTPRLYAHLYYRFGPFMWLPLCLLSAFLIGWMIAFLVRQWCGDWGPGLVAGSFWLMTSEVLVGHHAPVRYAKDFATLEILGILSLLLALRKPGKARLWAAGSAITVFWWIGLFTDEYVLFTLPAFAVAVLSWPWLRRVRWPVLIVITALSATGIWLYLEILPTFITPDYRDPFVLIKLNDFPDFGTLLGRNLNYLLLNTWDNLTYTFGSPIPRNGLQIVLASIAGLAILASITAARAWKGWGRMILFWALAVVFAGGVLLPEGRDILHQHTYYNRPLIALFLVVLGLLTFRVFQSRLRFLPVLWLAALVLCASLNYYTVATSVQDDPEEAYLTRYGLENILRLHSRLRSGELQGPVFLSYPRFRNVISGVYDELEPAPLYTSDNGFPWSLYRALVPRLYLSHFETGEVRADPRQFARWAESEEHLYRAGVRFIYDMPAGVAWDLESIRRDRLLSSGPLEWKSEDGRSLPATLAADLLGETSFARLSRGEWCASLPVPVDGKDYELLFAVRHEGKAFFSVDNSGETESTYRWAWRLFSVGLEPSAGTAKLCLKTDGEAEVIGPLVVPAVAVAPVPYSAREAILPAGVPLLDLRGER